MSDYISREQALSVFGDIHPLDHNANAYKAQIEKMPSADVRENIQGKWISHREHCEMNNLIPSGLGSYMWCSECDCGIDSKHFHRVNHNFCPNCGADMKGGK